MLPIQIYVKCQNINALNDLKDFLIKVFDNPRINNRYAAAKDGESSGTTFSMVKNVDTPNLGATAEMGELVSKIDSIELSLHVLNNKGPYKTQFSHCRLDPLTVTHTSFKMIGDQAKAPPEIPIVVILIDIRATGEVRQTSIIVKGEDFMPAQMLDAQELASRTPDKDRFCCHYYQKIGHFIKDCRKCIRDEKNVAKYSLLG